MSDDQTPIEGKGEEMVPNRGLPFDEVGAEEEPVLDDIANETAQEVVAEEALGQQEAEMPEQEATADEWFNAADELETEMNEVFKHDEDFPTTAPDFDGDAELDFAASDEPLELAKAAITPAPPPENVVAEAEFSAETTTIQESPAMTTIKTEKVEGKRVFSDAALALPGPVSGNAEEKAPETVSGLKATKKLLDLLVPNQRVEQLWERADHLQNLIFEEINDLHLARALLEQIRSAKNLMLADKENYEEAERAVNEVEYRIAYGKRFKKWGGLGYLLLAYEVIWGVAAVIAMGLLLGVGIDGLNLSVPGLLSNSEIFIGVFASLFGALGGVAGALFALWRYITEQKFNPQFSIWYITQPIIGLTIGSVIYIILKVGLSLTTGSVSTEIGSFFLPCLLAYLAGFQQNVFLDLAKQILKQIKVGKDEKDNQPGGNADE